MTSADHLLYMYALHIADEKCAAKLTGCGTTLPYKNKCFMF